jgi:hypothetical protein
LKVEVNRLIKNSIDFEQKWGFSQFAFSLTTIIKPVKEEGRTPPALALNLCRRFQYWLGEKILLIVLSSSKVSML